MKGISAGRLRHRIAVEDRVITRDPETGAQIENWAPVFRLENVAAEIAPLSTREFLSAAAIQSEVRGRIVIRYAPGYAGLLHGAMRARDLRTNLVYQFAGTPFPDVDTGRTWLTIPVQAGVVAA